MSHLVIGSKGQVGKALITVLSEGQFLKVEGLDIGVLPISAKFSIIHICIPFNDEFVDAVQKYLDKYLTKDGLVIIHSTVDVSTSSYFNAVHSPIRGVHPHLVSGIYTFTKYFGGARAEEAAVVFRKLGIDCVTTPKSETTEAMKLWDTTYYGWNIVFEKAVKAYCDQLGLDFDLVYTQANKSYNSGYASLGMKNVQRPVLKDYPGGIGGHCIQNNAMILHESIGQSVGKNILEQVLMAGQSLKEDEKPISNRSWLYCEYWGKKKGSEQIGKELGCTGANIIRSMRYRNIKRRDRIWTNSEIENLIELSETKTFKEISEILGKTHDAIRLKAIKLGLESCYLPGEQTKREATRKKISCTLQGITESEWDGFKASANALIRKSEEYQNWRKSVFKRDEYKCMDCKATGFLHAHHIKEFAKYPELRFDIDNGLTLCEPCHKKVHRVNSVEL